MWDWSEEFPRMQLDLLRNREHPDMLIVDTYADR